MYSSKHISVPAIQCAAATLVTLLLLPSCFSQHSSNVMSQNDRKHSVNVYHGVWGAFVGTVDFTLGSSRVSEHRLAGLMLPWDRESQAYPGVRFPADLAEVTTAEFTDLTCLRGLCGFLVCCQQSAAGPVFKQLIWLFYETCRLWLSGRERDSFQNAFTGVWGVQGHTIIMSLLCQTICYPPCVKQQSQRLDMDGIIFGGVLRRVTESMHTIVT